MIDSRRQLLKTVGLLSVASSLPLADLFARGALETDNEGFVIDAEAQETYLIAGRQAPIVHL